MVHFEHICPCVSSRELSGEYDSGCSLYSVYVVCRDGSEKELYKEQAMHSTADVIKRITSVA